MAGIEGPVVVTYVRFDDEADAIHVAGGLVIGIGRPGADRLRAANARPTARSAWRGTGRRLLLGPR